ncbi:MAG: hypothetical protein IJZ75_01740 [Clostridia bacterium]|nr:hypothetical protein [Clostridia bacterium]
MKKNDFLGGISGLLHKGKEKPMSAQIIKDTVEPHNNIEEFEHCVLCGALTNVPAALSVKHRQNYVIGLGQLCQRCQGKLDREMREENQNN